MRKMRKTARVLFAAALLIGSGFFLSANGLNLNGVGSKAIAMGGAFIGQADDYSAVFWNPAGLSLMKETSVSLFGTDLIPSATYQFGGIEVKSENKMYLSGAAGFFKPISDKLVMGFLVYVPAGSGAKWNGEDLKILTKNTPLEWESQIAVVTISPAVSYKVSDILSVGATLNINYGMMKLKKPALYPADSLTPMFAKQYSEDSTAWGFGATFGLLLKPNENLSIGLTVRTPSKINFKGSAENGLAPILLHASETSDIEREATWPLWVGFGISLKATDKLTINADAQYTNWKKVDKITATYTDPVWQAALAEKAALELNWQDKIQYRIGLEYKLSEKLALRAGYYYDPVVGPDETFSIILPQFTYNAVTAGFGYRTKKLSLDACLEYLMGKERTIGSNVYSMNILVPNIAVTYRF